MSFFRFPVAGNFDQNKDIEMMNNVKVIAFDGDDTLWINEPLFQQTEAEFCKLLAEMLPAEEVSARLFAHEMKNLPLYGYGIKGFTLCMLETACEVAKERFDQRLAAEVLALGKQLLQAPVELIPGVEEVLAGLEGRYRLVLATKGDLLDQERKLRASGLSKYFHHIEVMSDKHAADYQKLIRHLDCAPEHFLMVGNSMKSDVIPVLSLNSHAVYIPFHVTWSHELHDGKGGTADFLELTQISELLQYL